MIFPNNFEQKIGIDKVRELITEKCLSSLGEQKVAEMSFATDFKTIDKWLEQTAEFKQILLNKEEFPEDNYLDLRRPLTAIMDDPTVWLNEHDIAELAKSQETVIQIADFINKSNYAALKGIVASFATFPTIVDKANAIIDKHSLMVKDNASHELASIRSDKRDAVKEYNKSIQAALRDAQKSGIVERNAQVVMRDGFMTLPVSASNKRKIKGIIHQSSGNGKTVFIEPETVGQARKCVQELETAERREVARILIEFTAQVRPQTDGLLKTYELLAQTDFIRAKAGFAIRINGIKPVFEDKQQVVWYKAVHPLLNINMLVQNKKANPLDITLSGTDRLLIVSGANAGGKSMCLKTVALLQYMLQCGLLIPVQEGSRAGIFDHIFIDIGDGQSMENNLSTYTAHLTNMKFFVANCTSRTLLLIDEFGGGTEPQIGGAMAETLLGRFNDRKAFGVITTHFSNLKQFAYETEGLVNGAMLYDAEEMRPLYQLAIGRPGHSFAVEVARSIGLPEDIIQEATGKLANAK